MTQNEACPNEYPIEIGCAISAIIVGTENEAIAYLKDLPHSTFTAKDENGRTALHVAASVGKQRVCDFLLAKGANINDEDSESGFTALHRAAFYGNVHIVKLLIERGADKKVLDHEGLTPGDILCLNSDMLSFQPANHNKQAYAWGFNNDYNIGPINSMNNPEYWEGLNQVAPNIRQICMNKYHTLILDESGTAYGVGSGLGGRLGLSKESTVISPVPLLRMAIKVTMVAAGAHHSLFLSSDCEVWSCGSNQYRQLGLGVDVDSVTLPTKLNVPPIYGVAASKYHSVLWNRRHLHSCGLNGGQLGFSRSDRKLYWKPKLYDCSDVIERVVVSEGATVVAFQNNSFLIMHNFRNFKRSIDPRENPQNYHSLSCTGGKLQTPLLQNVTCQPLIVSVILDGLLYIYKEGYQHLSQFPVKPYRCPFRLRHLVLHAKGCTFTSEDYEGFHGTFVNNHTQLTYKKIPQLYRCSSIYADPLGKTFMALQIDVNSVRAGFEITGLARRLMTLPEGKPVKKLILEYPQKSSLSDLIVPPCPGKWKRKNENADLVKDVSFLCTDGVVVEFNRTLLAQNSIYFGAMFSGYWIEGTQKGAIGVDSDSKPFRSMLMFIAYKHVPTARFSYADTIGLLITANKFMELELQKVCELLLLEKAKPRDYPEILNLALSFGSRTLKQKIFLNICFQFQECYDQCFRVLDSVDAEDWSELSSFYKWLHFGVQDEAWENPLVKYKMRPPRFSITGSFKPPIFFTEISLGFGRRLRSVGKPRIVLSTEELEEKLLKYPSTPQETFDDWIAVSSREKSENKIHIKSPPNSKARSRTKSSSATKPHNSTSDSGQEVFEAISKSLPKKYEWVKVGKLCEKQKCSHDPQATSAVMPREQPEEDVDVGPPVNGAQLTKETCRKSGKVHLIAANDQYPRAQQNVNQCKATLEDLNLDDESFPTIANGTTRKKSKPQHPKHKTPKVQNATVPGSPGAAKGKPPAWKMAQTDQNESVDLVSVNFKQILETEESALQRQQHSRQIEKSLSLVQVEERAMKDLLEFYGGAFNPEELVTVNRVQVSGEKPEWATKSIL